MARAPACGAAAALPGAVPDALAWLGAGFGAGDTGRLMRSATTKGTVRGAVAAGGEGAAATVVGTAAVATAGEWLTAAVEEGAAAWVDAVATGGGMTGAIGCGAAGSGADMDAGRPALADAASGVAVLAAGLASATLVGGTAANASARGAAGVLVAWGALLSVAAMLAGGFATAGGAGGGALVETVVAVAGGLAAACAAGAGLAFLGAGAGVAATGALKAPLLLCVTGSTRCGMASAHPARPITASRQGSEHADRRGGESLVFGMAAA